MALLNNEKNIISAKTQPRIAAPAVNKIADGVTCLLWYLFALLTVFMSVVTSLFPSCF